MNDLELVAEVRAGRRQAYAELVRRHHARVLGLCAALLADRSAAEDAAQEIFLKAYRSLDRFRGAAAFSTWLYRVASNHCLDLARRESRRRVQSLDALLEGGESESRLPAAPDAAAALESADLARRALARLPDSYSLILILRETQGLSYEELAQTLDCSVDAVKARLQRARRELTQALRHFLEADSV